MWIETSGGGVLKYDGQTIPVHPPVAGRGEIGRGAHTCASCSQGRHSVVSVERARFNCGVGQRRPFIRILPRSPATAELWEEPTRGLVPS